MRLGSLVTVLCFGCTLYADVMYEKTLTTTGGALAATEISKQVFIKGEAARVEETVSLPEIGQQIRVMIYRFDRGVMWTLDMDGRQYTETALEDTVMGSRCSGESESLFNMPEITVQQTGATRKIVNKECEEVVVSIVEKSDSVKTELKRTLWVTQDLGGYEELITFHSKREEARRVLSGTGCIVEHTTCRQLPDDMGLVQGLPLECHELLMMSCEGAAVCLETHYIFTKLDDKPISQMVFEIPPGFTLQE